MSDRARASLAGIRAPAIVVPEGVDVDELTVAKLLAAVERYRVDEGRGPSFSIVARALGVRADARFVAFMHALRDARFVEYEPRRRGSLRMADRVGLASWCLRRLEGRAA